MVALLEDPAALVKRHPKLQALLDSYRLYDTKAPTGCTSRWLYYIICLCWLFDIAIKTKQASNATAPAWSLNRILCIRKFLTVEYGSAAEEEEEEEEDDDDDDDDDDDEEEEKEEEEKEKEGQEQKQKQEQQQEVQQEE
jgi:hypothetical protein